MKKFIMIICAIIIIFIGTLTMYKNNEKNVNNTSNSNDNSNLIIGNKPFYSRAGRIDEEEVKDNNKIVKTYKEYKDILDNYEIQYDLKKEDFNEFEYLAILTENDSCNGEIIGIEDAIINGKNINILINYESDCDICEPVIELYFIRFKKGTLKEEYKVNLNYQNTNINCN